MPIIKSKTFSADVARFFDLNTFPANCKKLSKVMRLIGWSWCDSEHDYPEHNEIQRALMIQFDQMMKLFINQDIITLIKMNGRFVSRSGGFTMTIGYSIESNSIVCLDSFDCVFDVWEHQAV